MLNIDQRALQRAPRSSANPGARCPASPPFSRRPQLAKGQGRRQSAEAGRRSFLGETDLNWIKYCLQGGESLSEEVVPHFSQNLNAIFTYMRARRRGGERKKRICHYLQEARDCPMSHAAWGQGDGSSSLPAFAVQALLEVNVELDGKT